MFNPRLNARTKGFERNIGFATRQGFQPTRTFDLPDFSNVPRGSTGFARGSTGFASTKLFHIDDIRNFRGTNNLPLHSEVFDSPNQSKPQEYIRAEIEDLPQAELAEIENEILVANIAQRTRLKAEEKQSLLTQILQKKFGGGANVQQILSTVSAKGVLRWLTISAVSTAIVTGVVTGGYALFSQTLYGDSAGNYGFLASFAIGAAGTLINNGFGRVADFAAKNSTLRKTHVIPFENLKNVIRLASKTGVFSAEIADITWGDTAGRLASGTSSALWMQYMMGGGLYGFVSRKGMEYVPLVVGKGVDKSVDIFNNSVSMWKRFQRAEEVMRLRAKDIVEKRCELPSTQKLPMDTTEILSDVAAVGLEVLQPLARVDPELDLEYTPDYSFTAQQHVVLENVEESSKKFTVGAAAAITTTLVVGLFTGKLQNVALLASQSNWIRTIVYQQINQRMGINAFARKGFAMAEDALKRIEFLNAKIPFVDSIKKERYLKELFQILLGTYYQDTTLKSMNDKELTKIVSSMGMRRDLVSRANKASLIQLIQRRQDQIFNLTYATVFQGIIDQGGMYATAMVSKAIFEGMFNAVQNQLEQYRLEAANNVILDQLANEKLDKARTDALEKAEALRTMREKAEKATFEAVLREKALEIANQKIVDATERERFAQSLEDAQNAANDIALAKLAAETAAEALRIADLNAANEALLMRLANDLFTSARDTMLNAANEAILKAISDKSLLDEQQKLQLESDLNALNDGVLQDLANELFWKLLPGPQNFLSPPALAVHKLFETLQSPEMKQFYEFDPILEEFVRSQTISYLTSFAPYVAAYEHAASYYNLGQDAARVAKAMSNVFTTIQAAKEGFPTKWTEKLRNLEPNAESTLLDRVAQSKLPSLKTILDSMLTPSAKINLGDLVAKSIYTSVKEGVRPAIGDALNDALFGTGTIGAMTKDAVRGLVNFGTITEETNDALNSLIKDAKGQLPK
jgi:hypothetical protein